MRNQEAIKRVYFANHKIDLWKGRMAQNDRKAVLLRRFPEDLHEQLRAEAEASERTVPAEIIYRLRASLKRRNSEEVATA